MKRRGGKQTIPDLTYPLLKLYEPTKTYSGHQCFAVGIAFVVSDLFFANDLPVHELLAQVCGDLLALAHMC